MEKYHGVKESGNLKEVSKRSFGLRGLRLIVRDKGSWLLLKVLSMVLRIGGQKPEYEQVEDGDKIAIDWKDQGLNLGCCDCGLVHFIDIEVIDHVVTLQFWRNEEETEKSRKIKGVEVVSAGDGS